MSDKKDKLQAQKGKIFPENYIIQIAIVLVVLAIANLILSGVFDEPEVAVGSGISEQIADPHSGVDLSNMDEIKSTEERVANNPNDFAAMKHLAHLYSESGLIQKAVVTYEKYVALQPGDFTMILEFSHFLHDNGIWQKAIFNYDKYLAKFPSNADVLVDQGVCYFSLSDYENAKRVMTNALKYDKKHVFANFNLGIVNINAGDTDQGKEWLRKVIELDPNSQMAKQAKEIIDSN
ncbi:MAG: tetratricopeptide repeat protein [Bacteroidetes bacterium]|nr:tetratricopeptide repeat protein [Bacteroidota bacterium]